MVHCGLHHEEADALRTEFDMPGARGIETAEKALAGANGIEAADTLEAFLHGCDAQRHEAIGVGGLGRVESKQNQLLFYNELCALAPERATGHCRDRPPYGTISTRANEPRPAMT